MDRLKVKMGVTTVYLPMVDLGVQDLSNWTSYQSGDNKWYVKAAGFSFDMSTYSAGFPDIQYGSYHITLENGMYITMSKLDDGASDDIMIQGIYNADGTGVGGITGMHYANQTKNESKFFGMIAYYQNKEWIGIGFRLGNDLIIAIPFLMNDKMTDDSMQEPYDDTGQDPIQGGWGSWDRSTDQVDAGSTPGSVMPFGAGISMYHVDSSAIESFEQFLWGSDEQIWSALWGRYVNYMFNPVAGVLSLHALPSDFFPTGSAATGIHVAGAFLFPISGTCNAVSTQFIDASWSMDLPEFYGDYMDYTGVKIVLHLPFCGVCNVDPVYCNGGGLTVLYRCDVCTGNVTAFVLARNRSGNTECIATLGGNCAYSVPVTGHNDGLYEMMGKAAVSIAGGVATVMTGTPINTGAMPEEPQEKTQVSGNHAGNSAITTNLQLYAEIVYTEPSNPDHYTELRGRPSDIYGLVGSFTGYTVFSDVHPDSIARATNQEKEMIAEYLKRGVII